MMERRDALDQMTAFTARSADAPYPRLEILENALRNAIPTVLYGPPGTGKTRLVLDAIRLIEASSGSTLTEIVQFHRRFTYEDFIEGFAPSADGFVRRNGVFLDFCQKAEDAAKLSIFVIDEINRADLSVTLGEVLYALEDRSSRMVKTAHFGTEFRIPENLALVATMNTADRGVSQIDLAIRRRFQFVPVYPSARNLHDWLANVPWLIQDFGVDDYVRLFSRTNARIVSNPLLGPDLQLGEALFIPKYGKPGIGAVELLQQFNGVVFPQIEAYVGARGRNSTAGIFNPAVADEYALNREVSWSKLVGLVEDSVNDQSTVD